MSKWEIEKVVPLGNFIINYSTTSFSAICHLVYYYDVFFHFSSFCQKRFIIKNFSQTTFRYYILCKLKVLTFKIQNNKWYKYSINTNYKNKNFDKDKPEARCETGNVNIASSTSPQKVNKWKNIYNEVKNKK